MEAGKSTTLSWCGDWADERFPRPYPKLATSDEGWCCRIPDEASTAPGLAGCGHCGDRQPGVRYTLVPSPSALVISFMIPSRASITAIFSGVSA